MEEQLTLHQPKTDAKALNIKELFFKYVRFLPLYIIFIALALMGAYVYLRYATEIYHATGQLVIRDEKTNGSTQEDKITQLMQSDNRKNVQTEVEIIQSRPVMSRVVEALNLNFNYVAKGRFKELDIYKMAPFRIEALHIADSSRPFTLNLYFPTQQSFMVNGSKEAFAFGQTFRNPYGVFRLQRVNNFDINPECKVIWNPTIDQANTLLKGLAVAPKQNTGILTIVMESANPILAADVINQLMEEYKQLTIEEKNEVNRKSLDFVDTTLKQREKELDTIKRLYVAYQKAQNIIDPQAQSTNYFGRVEDALKTEQDQRMLMNNAVQIQSYLGNGSNEYNTVPSSLGIEDPTLNALVSEYNKAQLERKALLENAPPGNVVVQQKTEEVEALRNKILENVKNIRSAYGTAIGMVHSTSSEALSQLKTLPNKKQELTNIQEQLAGKAKLYNELLSKREEFAIALASTISNTKVMQEALPDTNPVKPNRRYVQVFAILLGIFIPTLIIMVLELLNDKVSSRNDIERLTSATILGEVGHSVGGQTLVVTSGNRKVIAEQFRILRSNLQYVLPHVKKPVLMVTSSFSGEGKSFVSTNMGAVMALANKKTIILEFDIRKPKIISGLNLPKQAGLTNYILGQVAMEDLPVPVKGYENLYVLSCGPVPPNPSELLLDAKLNDLFAYLRQNFDAIIMDTAPVGMVSDAMTLSKFADCTIYIVRQGHTYKKQIGLIEEYYEQSKLPKISIVLNDVKASRGYGSYGGYGGYGYGYGYGYGAGYFDDDEQPSSRFNKWFGWLGMKNGTAKKHKKKKV